MGYYKIIENDIVVGASELKISNQSQECIEIDRTEYDEIKLMLDDKEKQEEIIQNEIYELEARLTDLSQDIVQIQCGADFGTRVDENGNVINIADERVAEFQEKHNRLRYLKGKEPRKYN